MSLWKLDWTQARQRYGTRMLQLMVGLMIWLRIATELRYARYLWGPGGLAEGAAFADAAGSWREFLCSRMWTLYGLLAAHALAALGLILGRYTRLATLVAYGVVSILAPRNALILDGGDNAIQLVLAFMLLLAPVERKLENGSLTAFFHNVGAATITLQAVIIYLSSGLYKASGERWTNGTAMFAIAQLDWFSLPIIRNMFFIPAVTTIATYAAMLYQLWFPMALFSSKLRFPWLVGGITMHVFIGIFMGLVPFSLVMIGLELFLIPDADYVRMHSSATAIKLRLGAFVRNRAMRTAQ
jgi:hypothetical protein